MEGEILNFIRVWASIFASAFYCYAVVRIVAKGWTVRVIMFVPVVCLFLLLPFTLTSVHLGCPTVFFISWLANFKLLLLAFGHGPLSDPSLSMGQFIIIACFPVVVQENQNLKQFQGHSRHTNGSPTKEECHSTPEYCTTRYLKKCSLFAVRALILAILLNLAQWREHLNPNIVLFCVCMYLYVGLDLMLGIVASVGQILLGIELETPFNAPYLSTSLKDFWGERWNRAASNILRSAVFEPILVYCSSHKGDRKWFPALMVTFIVSAMMHELLLFYLVRTRPTCYATLFFLLHGIFLVVETELKKKFVAKWSLPRLITGPLIFGFVILTFMWMVIPEVLEYNVDARALEESAALGQFLRDLVIFWKRSCYHLLSHNLNKILKN